MLLYTKGKEIASMGAVGLTGEKTKEEGPALPGLLPYSGGKDVRMKPKTRKRLSLLLAAGSIFLNIRTAGI